MLGLVTTDESAIVATIISDNRYALASIFSHELANLDGKAAVLLQSQQAFRRPHHLALMRSGSVAHFSRNILYIHTVYCYASPLHVLRHLYPQLRQAAP